MRRSLWTLRPIARDDARMGEDTASREVSRILCEAGEGRPVDAEALLPLVYEKLRAIAAYRMAGER